VALSRQAHLTLTEDVRSSGSVRVLLEHRSSAGRRPAVCRWTSIGGVGYMVGSLGALVGKLLLVRARRLERRISAEAFRHQALHLVGPHPDLYLMRGRDLVLLCAARVFVSRALEEQVAGAVSHAT
jgi:hypothetical protein